MSEWDIQSNRERVKTLLAMGVIPTWLEELLAEGDILQREKRSLLTYGGMLRDENARLEQKLEAILDGATNYTCWKDTEEMSKALLTALGDSAQNTDYVQKEEQE